MIVGVLLIGGSTVFTWVDVEVDLEAFGDLSDEVLESLEESDPEAAEAISGAADAVEAAREFIPDLLLDASLNGLNAFDLLGFGVLIVGLAVGAAIAGAVWALYGVGWLRWIGLVCAVLILLSVPAVVGTVFASATILEQFLPDDWQPYRPEFELTLAPLGAIAGSVVLVFGLLGKGPTIDTESRLPQPLR